MKTPEQIAEEYVDKNSGGECSDDTGGLRNAFLAGYQASEKDIHLHWNELWKDLHKRIEESSLPAMDAMEGRYLRQIKELEAAIPRWISVKERLPRPGQEVLAFDNEIVRVKAISTQNKWHPYINGSNCDPSHWMPLPKPPEDKE